MFEFEDNDFAQMESFSLFNDDDTCTDFEDQPQGTYLGDGVWVVDARENVGAAEPTHSNLRSPVSES